MPGTFFGLNLAYTGLAAAQIGQDVTGQNIANAGTDGYSVQSAQQQANDPFVSIDHTSFPLPGSLGTGVSVIRINRARDQFLDTQVRAATAGNNFQASQSSALKQVDDAFGEPSDTGLNAAIGNFFNAFHDLSNTPENLGVRATTIAQGDALARTFQGVGQRLAAVKTSVDSQAADDVTSINDYGAQIAALNVTIKQQTVQGQQPNDLLDRRDVLLDKLSALVNVAIRPNSDGTIGVQIGSTSLVTGLESSKVTQAGLTASGDLKSGELAGLASAQTQVAGYQGQLDTLASAVVTQVNAIHKSGYALDGTTTGLNFFSPTGTTAATIGVDPGLEGHPELLAAASAPVPPATTASPGDASNAEKLAGLKGATDTTPGDPTFGTTLLGYYQATVSDAGGRAASTKSATQTASATLSQLTQQRASATGVSTDAEMVNMMKYQRAYQASAKVVQTMDDMIGTLINNLFSAN